MSLEPSRRPEHGASLRPITGGRPPEAGFSALWRLAVIARRAMARRLLAETDRWFVWTPVFFGSGAALYLGLPAEPAGWVTGAVTGGALAFAGLAMRLRLAGDLRLVLAVIAIVACGLAIAQIRSSLVAAPMLDAERWPTAVSGRVLALDIGADGGRVLIGPVRVAGLAPDRTPSTVRLSLRRKDWLQGVRVGDWITLRAGLLPPPDPAMPGAFDFRRRAYFDGLGALGYAVTAPERIRAFEPSSLTGRLELAIERLRDTISARLSAALPGQSGALAAALVTGDRQGLTDDTRSAMRESGLAHLLAISGLHVGMLAGLIFFGVRLGLAAFPGIALRLPIKKIAAVAALAGALFYLLLAGATVPTQRAFLMTGIALIAVLLDRSPLSMRLVAVAAMVVLVFHPEAIESPSFQMSFAAVTALIAAFDGLRDRWRTWRGEAGLLRRVGLYCAGITLSSIVAGLATAPFALFHFGQVATYGLIGNLLAIPLMAFWIMPCGLLALTVMPFGLDGVVLVVMGEGLSVLLATAESIAALPGAVARTAGFSTAALAVMSAGGLWLALWRGRWRRWGTGAVGLGVLLGAISPVPDIVVARDGSPVGLRSPDGTLFVTTNRHGSFEIELWKQRLGASVVKSWARVPDRHAAESEGDRARAPPPGTRERVAHRPASVAAPFPSPTCDQSGCLAVLRGYTIAVPKRPAALDRDCRRASLVIAEFPIVPDCPAPQVVIDADDIARGGALSILLTEQGPVVHRAREPTGCRPWHRYAANDCRPSR